jgi:hypothetical protein
MAGALRRAEVGRESGSGTMREFFRGWRRKIGVVTLLIACLFMVGWVGSEVKDRWIMINNNATRTRFRVSSVNGRINILRWTPEKGRLISIGSDPALKDRNPLTGRHFRTPFEFWDEFKVEQRFDWAGFHYGNGRHHSWHEEKRIAIWFIPYWSIVCPLTIISLWLLLSKPRQSTSKKVSEPNQEKLD